MLWGICFFFILCIFCFEKLNIPRGEKFFRRSLYGETRKTCVILRRDELEKAPGNREPRPSTFLLFSSGLNPSSSLLVSSPGDQLLPITLGLRGGLATTKRKYRVGGKWLRTWVWGNRECKYSLLSFTRRKGTGQSLQILGWLSGSRLYAELSHFSQLLNAVVYRCARLLASKWTSFAPFRFIYYAVRCYLKEILWEKWLIYLHRPAFVLTGFICLCQRKLTMGCSRERAEHPRVLQTESVHRLGQSFQPLSLGHNYTKSSFLRTPVYTEYKITLKEYVQFLHILLCIRI